ncbi:methyl-accepting chemotaxis protein [Sphingomonas sp. 35-24ZXX]|uniref:methyl-accepting chemotaxis protein n=1 Tax=Sphingomonas sp. 35-24ZXX TaxID=1545915 RepID=UPI00053BE46B|nr:methyl-accepting chemotaxis protein [Sphingomonas sp. 35-24ZXX]
MISHFALHAPIRQKFDIIIGVLVAVALAPLAISLLGWGGGIAAIVIEVAVPVAVAGLLMAAKKLICDPYVNTVVRMEGLATGDMTSPLPYIDNRDCVGRMSKAMLIFKDNAVARAKADMALEDIIAGVTTALNRLKDGDLTHAIVIDADVDTKANAISHAYNDATSELSGLLGKVASAANNVLTGASEIRSASSDLAQRTEQQAASLEESAAAMQEVTAMVQETAKNASEVGKQMSEAHAAATTGGEVVQRAVGAMGAIQKSSSQINSIIDVIDGIAFQTNLLALNAGVEAARAGDAGKGFAVVANEVRALAQRSADAAKNIKELITASTAGVSDGVALVDETGSVLLQISERVAAINARITEISASTQSQALRLQQVNLAVGDMDKMTQQNAAMVEESNAAARSLAEEATDLSQVVQRFSTGQTARPAPSPTRAVRQAPAARAPMVSGNLALRMDEPQDDWAEF